MLRTGLQTLKTDFENAKIIDNRDPENPNNRIVIVCEHASNALPEGYSWTEHDEKHFANEHWGYDIGSLEMAKALAVELKCVLVHSLWSRLILDVNRSIVSDTLFRKSGDGREIDMNKDLTYEEEQLRIKKYYLSFYEALREVSQKVDPEYILSVHSFTPNYEGQVRDLEIGVLFGEDSKNFAMTIYKEMKEKGYLVEQNVPYDGSTTITAVKSLIFAKNCLAREGITIEFRNDILTDSRKFPRFMQDTKESVEKVYRQD